MKKTYTVPSVSTLIGNLNVAALDVGSAISNAQKSAERVEWLTQAMRENRLTDFLGVVEETLNSLPEGTIEQATVNPVTGKQGTKKINQRDIAKNSYKTAYGHASKTVKKFEGTQLTFKLSLPVIADKKAPATLEDKIANLLKEKVDSKGLKSVMGAVNKAMADHTDSVAKLASDFHAMQLATRLQADFTSMVARGKTNEQAEQLAASMNDMSIEEFKQAVG